MYLSEQLEEKWGGILNHTDLPEIKDPHKRAVTAIMLENQQKALSEDRQMLLEASPANNSFATAGVDRYDPILIGLVTRAMPQ